MPTDVLAHARDAVGGKLVKHTMEYERHAASRSNFTIASRAYSRDTELLASIGAFGGHAAAGVLLQVHKRESYDWRVQHRGN